MALKLSKCEFEETEERYRIHKAFAKNANATEVVYRLNT